MTATMSDPLISPDYRAQQTALHRANPDYGSASVAYAPLVADLMKRNRLARLLDYGAGKGRLAKALNEMLPFPFAAVHYDPAIPEWSAPPAPEDLVCCIDVLEHVEPDRLDAVLDDLARVTRRIGFFTIHTGPAQKILADGRNAHLVQQPPEWWLPRLMARFELLTFHRVEDGFRVLVGPKAPVG